MLCAGVTRWKGRLDWVIRELRPRGTIDPILRQILRLGVYELVELGLPDHVISDHVDMARKLVRPEAAPVANGEHSVPEMGHLQDAPEPGAQGPQQRTLSLYSSQKSMCAGMLMHRRSCAIAGQADFTSRAPLSELPAAAVLWMMH